MQDQVAAYLKAQLPGSPDVTVANVRRIPGGASRETWSFDASWSEDGRSLNEGFIIRRDPDASVLETDRDLEFRVMDVAHRHGVPVPKMRWLEQGTEWLERPFFVMERIDGCEASPSKVLMDPSFLAGRARMTDGFVEALAKIHAIDVGPDLAFLGPPPAVDACGMAEIARWEEIVARDSLEPQPVLNAAFRWLRLNQPPPAERIVLVHADYRTGNFLSTPEGEIKGILDWEMAHLGDPVEDVAWACIRPWRWLGYELVGGLMEREDFLERYTRATGIATSEEALRFWEVLGNVKLAAIFITGGRSFCDGRTRAPMMALLGRSIGRLELEIMDLMGV
jgi:aminoglycoside phosphotransferase (APT) family kinase protein